MKFSLKKNTTTADLSIMNDRLIKRRATSARHKNMTCRSYEIKIDRSKLSQRKIDYFNLLFKEAKWLRNYFLTQDNFSDCDCKKKEVVVKVGDAFETRELQVLSSQMRQGIREKLIQDCISLKKRKQAGYKIGKLKFKSVCNSIYLPQFKYTYDFDKEHNRIHLQGLKGWVKVHGLDQIVGEVASATLLRKASGIYLNIITWHEPEIRIQNNCSIGIDGGCSKALTLSNNLQLNWDLPATKQMRKLDRKIMKKKRAKSNNKYKDQCKRRKQHEKLTNRKKDTHHKVVRVLKDNFEYIFVQDESIKAWHAGRHGKRMQNTSLGELYKVLKPLASMVVSKFFPSTQLCPSCGCKKKLLLSERIYACECGFQSHRDLKAARCIEYEGLKTLGTEYTKVTLGENSTSAESEKVFNLFRRIPHLLVSKLNSSSQEA